MLLHNLWKVPVMLVADIVSLGNMGDKSFTQQLIDRDKEEQKTNEEIKKLNAASNFLRETRNQ